MDKRKQLLEAALKLFVGFGFHGTPTSKIAEAAGVANGTLFHYFKTKDDLIVALYIDIKLRLLEYVGQNAKTENTLKGTLKGLYLASLYWTLDNEAESKYIEQFRSSPFFIQIPPEQIENQTKFFFDLLKKGIKDKIVKPLPVDLIHVLINSHISGINQYLAANKFSKAKQHQVLTDSFELLWDMIT
ncbi:MAG: TetR family transcriptional regulator [Marivirga sp.]|nr:TetR family transcriptional regulator [Marivirga sp.]